ncbi:hypothetical protein PVBG_05979 [Plasmodium vivax Brazil I]|uniref:Variable surface protein Vir35 n=1 Tax=Plasmodium vivax (strain Brazil I) TaxID=1033975 RepID=A0A0J9VQ29_PLAV1|nr:hypothetical protein PVBG_05979 [Plasmodium vivax Brazil I]
MMLVTILFKKNIIFIKNENYHNLCLDVKKNDHDITVNRTYRLLSKDALQNELTINNPYYKDKLTGGKDNIGTYAKLKQGRSDNFETYKKNLRRNHSRKKGLKKLDCYCEEKIFKGIEKLDNLAQNMDRSKMKFTNIIFKKYCIRIIFSSLIAIFAITLPILNEIDSNVDGNNGSKLKILAYLSEKLIPNFENICTALIFASGIMMFFVCIYTLIKIIKYEGIKTGKNKMSIMDYFILYKDGL